MSEWKVWDQKLHNPTEPPIFLSFEFLKDITCDFSADLELGRGGYGVVYKGVLPSGTIIAVKKMFDVHTVEDDPFQQQVSNLMAIKHKNIVRLLGYCAESRWEAMRLPSGTHVMAQIPRRLLCFEYLCNNSLEKYISGTVLRQ
ncbi:hypothetical protein PR202_ga24708 [Eleusine coracana subsp. coracana]|uniref:Protein kinase domain-containing protein n=1 Tax=Eleusine coracana subsp. coracana TaxID=191504 RepID=A0AAV5D940_ELECO|nr:hypothetical protein PR202_ga24708 [Eleusine coracana subsp. coracana]